MPCNKKIDHPQVYTSASRRLVPSLSIPDSISRACHLPNSQSFIPSFSGQCSCGEEESTLCPCDRGNPQEPKSTLQSCVPACKDIKDIVTVDNNPCCRDIFQKPDQEEPKSEATSPCCAPTKPKATECPIKKCPISIIPPNLASKKDACCGIPDCLESFNTLTTPKGSYENNSTFKVNPQIKEEECSIASCALDVSLKNSKCTSTDSEFLSERSHKELEPTGNAAPKLRAMPTSTPIPSRKSSATIANHSSLKALGRVSKDYDKDDKEEPKKSRFKLCRRKSKSKVKNEDAEAEQSSKDKEKSATSCTHLKCKTNTCTCRFPPAYSQYYDCTGQISGICNCEKDN